MTGTFYEWPDRDFDPPEPLEPDDAVWVERPVDESFEDEPVEDAAD